MKKIYEIKNPGVVVAKLTNLVDSSFAFNEVAIADIKKYVKKELDVELDKVIINTNINCDLLTKRARPTGSHCSSSNHSLEVFKTSENKHVAKLYLSERICIDQY